MYTPCIDLKRIQYYRRKGELDKTLVWTKDIVQSLRDLNTGLTLLQNQLVDEMRSACALFSKLEKNGMPFLHGFKVTGKISFEKEILNELYDVENPTDEQKEIMDKWDSITYYTKDELSAWHLILDSETHDFLPWSKILLNQKRPCHSIVLPKGEKNIDCCSFFSHFVDYNTTFGVQDFAECTIRDFSIDISVLLNYDVSEIKDFNNFITYYGINNDVTRCMIDDRKRHLDMSFRWNEENILKLMNVNNWLWKYTDKLKSYLSDLKAAFTILSETDPHFKYYSIEGQIEYHGSEPNDIASLELQKVLSKQEDFRNWFLSVDEECQEIRDHVHENDDINWNFEVYRHYLTEEQRKVKFHHLMHSLFVDGHVYSFEDVVRMREEDFKVCLEINWSGD